MHCGKNVFKIAPVAQWTDQPKDEGYHWAMVGESRGLVMVHVRYDFESDYDECEDENYIVEHNGNPKRLPLDEYIDMFHVSGFCKVTIPALPEKGGSE